MADIEQFIRDAARVRGIDPDTAVTVARMEGGVDTPAAHGDFDTGDSWWPFQSDIAPDRTVQDVANRCSPDVVLSGESLCPDAASGVARPNLAHMTFRQSGTAVGFATRMPLLRDHVRVVIGERPEEQVIRTDARTVIAAVEDIQAVRDWAAMQSPRDTVHVVADEGAVLSTDRDVAVAGALTDAGGFPACIGLVDPAPETGFEVLLSEASCGIMDMHQITPGAVPSAVDAARGLLDGILP